MYFFLLYLSRLVRTLLYAAASQGRKGNSRLSNCSYALRIWCKNQAISWLIVNSFFPPFFWWFLVISGLVMSKKMYIRRIRPWTTFSLWQLSNFLKSIGTFTEEPLPRMTSNNNPPFLSPQWPYRFLKIRINYNTKAFISNNLSMDTCSSQSVTWQRNLAHFYYIE